MLVFVLQLQTRTTSFHNFYLFGSVPKFGFTTASRVEANGFSIKAVQTKMHCITAKSPLPPGRIHFLTIDYGPQVDSVNQSDISSGQQTSQRLRLSNFHSSDV